MDQTTLDRSTFLLDMLDRRHVVFIHVRRRGGGEKKEEKSWLSFQRQAVAAVRVQTLYFGTLNTGQKACSNVNHLWCNLKHEATALPAHPGESLRQTMAFQSFTEKKSSPCGQLQLRLQSKSGPVLVLHRACGGGHWDQLPGDSLAHVSLIWTQVGKQG